MSNNYLLFVKEHNIHSFLEKEYHLQVKFLSLLQDGSDNLVYKVVADDEQAYVLRVSKRENKAQDISFELEIISFLHKRGLPVPQIIQTCQKKNFCLLNKLPVCLFSFCSGKNFQLSLSHKPSIQMAVNGGRALATVHKALSDNRELLDLQTERSLFYEVERVLNQKELFFKKYISGDVFVKNLERTLQEVRPLYVKETIIHNDFRLQNLLFEGDEVSAILDFDWACVGTGLKDLGHALIEWSFPDGAKECWWNILKAFLAGYREIYPDIDLKRLLTWIRFSCLSDASTYFMDTIEREKEPRQLNSYMYHKYLFFCGEGIEDLFFL